MRSISRACGLLATMIPLAMGAACSDPELASELDTDGPPEVVEVNIASESASPDPNGNDIEAATFCRPGEDVKVSTFYCPEDRDGSDAPMRGKRETDPLRDATPIDWHVRFVFSELLDPDIEDLVDGAGSLLETQPAILRCGGAELAYDGYYDPSGSHLSYPPGPSLVVKPIDFVATGTDDCEVELKDGDAVDKDGDAVPENHLGPYEFGVAVLSVKVDESDPPDMATGTDPTAPITIQFNAPVELGTVTDRVVLSDGEAEVPVTISAFTDPDTDEEDPSAVVATPDAPLAANTTYTVTVEPGVADIAGGELEDAGSFSFTTGDAPSE
jgi:Bacterial Ig-like domain